MRLKSAYRRLLGPILALIPLAIPSPAHAQLGPVNPPPAWGQVPQGTGACSVQKSCADLAPGMIQSALGPSPLAENLRYLKDSIGVYKAGSPASAQTVAWAVEAFRRAGVDSVHVEEFAGSPSGGAVGSGPGDVIAEIRGRDMPATYVLIGTSLDSRGAGAADDAAGDVAAVIDAARVIHTSGTIPRRSIRFVLFTGSGQGMISSWAYVQAHRAGLDRIAAAIILDGRAGRVNGYSLGDRKDALPAIREALKPLQSLGVTQFMLDTDLHSDGLPFLLEGIPALAAIAQPNKEQAESGAMGASPSSPDLAELKRRSAIAAISAYALADAEERPGPRSSLAEVEQWLNSTGLAAKLKAKGQLPAWYAGEGDPGR